MKAIFTLEGNLTYTLVFEKDIDIDELKQVFQKNKDKYIDISGINGHQLIKQDKIIMISIEDGE